MIPTKSSKTLASLEKALKASQVQGDNLSAIDQDGPLSRRMTNLLIPLVFGVSQPRTSTDELIPILGQGS